MYILRSHVLTLGAFLQLVCHILCPFSRAVATAPFGDSMVTLATTNFGLLVYT